MAVALFAIGSTAAPALAEDEISIEPTQVVFAEPGSMVSVAYAEVPADLVGQPCDLRVTADNGSSIHPGNTLITTTGENRSVVEGVEDNPDGSVIDIHRVVLGETIAVEIQLGSDGASSLGFTVGFECTESELLPLQQVPTATTLATTPTTTATTEAAATPNEPAAVVESTTSTSEATSVPTVLPSTQVAPPLQESPPATPTVGNPTFTG